MQKKKNILTTLLLIVTFLFALPITVSAAVQISSTEESILIGQKVKLSITGTKKPVEWSTSNKAIAIVSKKGVVKGKKRGTAIITATVNGKRSYSCKVTVNQPVTEIALNATSYFLLPGKTYQLKASVSPSTAADKTVKWSSSNKKIAKVSAKGKVTAVANGTATITCTAKDGSGVTMTCVIIVLKGDTTSATPAKPAEPAKPVATPSTTTTSGVKTQKLLKALEKYSKRIESDTKNGIKWTYSNDNPPRTYQEAIAGNRKVNCALIATWALKDIGIFEYYDYLYGKDDGTIKFKITNSDGGAATKKKITSNGKIIKATQSMQDLVASGKVKAGDIMIYKGHTNIFAGYDKTTKKYNYYDAGRMGSNGAYVKGVYHFSTFKISTSSPVKDPTYYIRLN